MRRGPLLAAVTAAGAAQLGVSLASEPDSPRFYALTGGVAATWIAGGIGLGRPHRGRGGIVGPVALGVGAFGAFYGVALVARKVPLLRRALSSVLRYAHYGDTPTVLATTLVNGVAEEVFFRGALYDACAERPLAASTAVYALVTCATRNPALVLASMVMGTLFGWQRRNTGGILAPILTHLTWSTLMLLLLPPLFHDQAANASASNAVAAANERRSATGS